MSKFTLEITLGSDAMQTPTDVRDALSALADRIDFVSGGEFQPHQSGGIRDANGNTVGRWEVSE